MLKKIRNNYQHTIYACFIGYIVQAIVNNFVPLLFLTLARQYHISIEQISMMIFINFSVQLLVDFVSAKFVDRIGYKTCVIIAHIFAVMGLAGLTIFPEICENAFAGILIAVILYAIGGGLLEVLVSPIVEACPTERKEATMSLLHSFYCWGYAGVILLSTIFFALLGIENWKILACLWASIPLFNILYFSLISVPAFEEHIEKLKVKNLLKNQRFWLLVLLMLCAGACEQSISQWASAFAERGLGVSKMIGDLAGPLMFAILMGSARVIYAKYSEKIELWKYMLFCGILCMISYLLISLTSYPILGLLGCALCGFSVGVLWPGTFSMATKEIKGGGTALFAFLALAGDLGCSIGPRLVGVITEGTGSNMKKGIFAATIFPILLICFLIFIKIKDKKIENYTI